MTDAGSEFQTDGAAHRKERFVKSVRANCWLSSGILRLKGTKFDSGSAARDAIGPYF